MSPISLALKTLQLNLSGGIGLSIVPAYPTNDRAL